MVIKDEDETKSNDINSIVEDRFGNIWLGTNGSGLCTYDGTRFVYITSEEGLPEELI